MRVKAKATVTAKMDSVIIAVSIYSNKEDMKKTLEDNIQHTRAIQAFLDKDTPHKKEVLVSFGTPMRKSIRVVDKTTNEFGKTTETTRWDFQGYEMRSYVSVEISLSSEYKIHNVYNEVVKYEGCTVNVNYAFSAEHEKDIAKALREKLITEADNQIHDILPNTDVVMTDFSYHCELPQYERGMGFGKAMYNESVNCKDGARYEEDASLAEEYAALIDELINVEMAPEREFSDEISVEYTLKKG